jgi:hypothetical protein
MVYRVYGFVSCACVIDLAHDIVLLRLVVIVHAG